jgi:hypothetical protein
MKIAVLMHGMVGNTDKYGTGKYVDPAISHKHFKKHIINVNDSVDVFMHSWSVDFENKLKELYSPVNQVFEDQIVFDFEYAVGDPSGPGGESNRWVDGKFKGVENLRFHSMFSRWYSAKIANDLKKEHEDKNNFKYDFVMLTRYDLAYLVDFNFNKFDPNKFYAIPPVSNHGIQDLWFISNSETMDAFCHMYDWIKQINHFPHKFTHSHWLAKHYIDQTGIVRNLDFFGSERPWGMGPAGAKLGPSPLVRDHYDLSEATPDEDMGKVRDQIKKNTKKTISE